LIKTCILRINAFDPPTRVELGEQLDIQRHCQRRPGTFAKNSMGEVVVIDVEAISGGQNITDHRVDRAEQRLVFWLLVAEPYQRLKRNLVAEPVILAQFQDLGIDKALDQTKDIGVGAALYLTELSKAEQTTFDAALASYCNGVGISIASTQLLQTDSVEKAPQ